MMKLRGKVWLAVAFVALAALVFTGCPHNDVLYKSGGASGGSSRHDAGGNVQLVITNFANGGAPSRTIAPGHIDIKGSVADYVFVATGTGGGTYGPEFIDVDGTTGVASLGIAGGGIWEIKVEAYALAKLGAVAGGDKQIIMEGPVADVTAHKASALVLQGAATVDFNNGSGAVTLTLTNDGVGTQGSVNVDIYFDTQTDKDKIRDQNYKVDVALYDLVTGIEIQTIGMATTKQTVHTVGGGAPADPVSYNVGDVPKGHYQFRVTVSDNMDAVKAYWVDDIYVEGNRDTAQDVHIQDLFHTPDPLTDFDVYWSTKEDNELKEGYLAYFTWDGLAYNAVGVTIEVADITQWYSYDAGQHRIDFGTGVENFTRDNIWTKIEALRTPPGQVSFDDVVTTLSWNATPQDATKYPIWKGGSLLNGGDNHAIFLMETGHVYTARIRAAGAQDNSTNIVIGTGAGLTAPPLLGTARNPAGGGIAAEFTQTEIIGTFDLVEIAYDMQSTYAMYKAAGPTNIGTIATKDDLRVLKEYKGGQNITLEMKYVNMETPAINDWFLYKIGNTGNIDQRIKTWTGWQDLSNPTLKFPIVGAAPNLNYAGHKNLNLIPIGAAGNVGVSAETSGTFNVLTEDKVLVNIAADDTSTADAVGWQTLTTGATNGGTGTIKDTLLGLQKDNSRYILNLDSQAKTAGMGTPTVLYVSVGKDTTPDGVGKLQDQNTNDFDVQSVNVYLYKGISKVTTFTTKAGPMAVCKLDGLGSGDYTLKVEILTDSGYTITYQAPLAVKYNNQVIR